MEKKAVRIVRAQRDNSGIVIFRLIEGEGKRTVRAFGYGTRHKIWLRIEGLGTGRVLMTTESAAVVKEKIADWSQ